MKVLFCADLHLREDVPKCRGENEDEWLEFQTKALYEIFGNQGCIPFIAGDIFHREDAGNVLTGRFLAVVFWHKVLERLRFMPGNHDLHKGILTDETAYSVIAPFNTPSDYVPWNSETPVIGKGKSDVLMVHALTFEKAEDVPFGVKHYETPETLVAKYPGYKAIVVGDMHRPFSKKVGDTWVVNCGSMTVQSTTEIPYQHGYWLWDTEAQDAPKFVPLALPIVLQDESVSRSKEEKDERVKALMLDLLQYHNKGLDFEAKLLRALTELGVRVTISQLAKKWLL